MGNVWLLRRVLPSMVEARWGRIVFISSVSTVNGTGRYGAYVLCKSALEGLVRNLAVDYGEFNVDLLAEFKYGGGGWVTLEGAYYHFQGEFEGVRDAGFVLAAIATPKIGAGNLQPMVRYQWGSREDADEVSQIDASLGYLVKGPALRVTAGLIENTGESGTSG